MQGCVPAGAALASLPARHWKKIDEDPLKRYLHPCVPASAVLTSCVGGGRAAMAFEGRQ